MKNMENMNALNEMEMAKVAGGDGVPKIFNPGPDMDMGQENGRQLPFPQDRSGNKAPVEATVNAPCRRGKC